MTTVKKERKAYSIEFKEEASTSDREITLSAEYARLKRQVGIMHG